MERTQYVGKEIIEPTLAPVAERDAKGRLLPGHKRLGSGRKGRPNRFTLNARQAAEEAGFSPVHIAMDVILHGKLPPIKGRQERIVNDEERLKMLREIIQFMVPRLSATQLNTTGTVAVEQSIDILAIMADPDMAQAAQKLALGITYPKQLGPAEENQGL